ncbi:MAG: hypothetical protein AB1791_19580, partial [Chloroflexota bacterium]
LTHHRLPFLLLLATLLLAGRPTRAANHQLPITHNQPTGGFSLTERTVETDTPLNSRPAGVNAPAAQTAQATATNTAPTGGAAVTAQAGNGTLTDSPPAGAISPSAQAQNSAATDVRPTGLVAPSAQIENSTLITIAPTGAAPITAQTQDSSEIGTPPGDPPLITIQAADSITTTTPQGDVPASESGVYYTGVLSVSGQTLYFLLSDPLSAGEYQALDLSLGDDVFGEIAGGSLSDEVVDDGPPANDERLTSGPNTIQIGAILDFGVNYSLDPAADPDDANITAASWFSDNLNVDVDDDDLTEPVYFTLGDTNSDGAYDTLDLSLNGSYGQGTLDDGIVGTGEDERLTAAGGVRLGDTLFFTVDFTAAPDNSTNDAEATSTTWFTATLNVDVDDDAATEPVNGILSDADSNGLYDSLDLSLDTTYGQGSLGDGVMDTGNDERLTADGGVRLGPTLTFALAFAETPAASSDDLSVTTATWFTGTLDVDVDDDGSLEEVNLAFNDPNSDGVYGTLELSLDPTYGQGDLNDEVVSTNNDERLTAGADVRLGATLLFDLTFDDNPGGDSSDVRATSQTWFTGLWSIDVDANSSLEMVNFSLGDAGSDGLYDTLDVSLDPTYGQGSLGDGVVNTGNDERVTTSPTNVTLGSALRFSLAFDGNPNGDSSDARATSATWYTGLLNVDANADGTAENVYFAFTDSESNGLYDTLDVSLDTTYGQGVLTDSLVNTGNDERLPSSPADLTLGTMLLFSLTFVNNPGGAVSDVTLTSQTWFQGTEALRLEGPRYDSLLADADSDGLYDDAYLDLSDDNDFDDPDDWGPLITGDTFDDAGLELQYTILAMAADGSAFEVAPTDGTVQQTPDWWVGRVTVETGDFAVAVSDSDADDVYDRADFDANGDKIVDDAGNAEGDQVTLGGQVYTVVDIADDGSSVTLAADIEVHLLYLPAVLYLYYPFDNGGFELGSLTYWTEGGALNRSVVTALDRDGLAGGQTLPAIEGSYTAELGDPGYVNLGGVPIGHADLRQTFTLPDQGITTLSFQYRVFTHDLIYSEFDDTYYDSFEVFLNSESYGGRRDSLCRLGGSWQAADGDGLILCDGNDSQFPTLGNPPYDTGLQTVSFDVSDYAGSNLTLIFRVYNRIDGNYNTWAYVDNVTIEP